MLIEIKAKVARNVNGNTRTSTELYLKDAEFFSEAEYEVSSLLEQQGGEVADYSIISLRQSPIKEFLNSKTDDEEQSYIASLRAAYTDDNGNEKAMHYKTLLWAHSLTEANTRAQNYSREGYDMKIESITEKEYTVC